MTSRQPTNLPASIRQRLLNLSRDRGEDFNLTLTRYGTERLLYRLSQSERADHFGPTARPSRTCADKLSVCRALGFDGVQFHDDEAVPNTDDLERTF